MKISIMGASILTNNRGVSALAVSIVDIISRIDDSIDISFIIGNRDSVIQRIVTPNGIYDVPTIGYRLSLKSPFNRHLLITLLVAIMIRIIPFEFIRKLFIENFPIIKEVSDADLVADIQGGDSFSDIYGINKFLIGTIPLIIAIIMKKRVVLLPQTHGPFKSRISRLIARLILSKANTIYSRDKGSIEDVNKLFLNKKTMKPKINLCPDVAFVLQPIKPTKVHIMPPLTNNYNKLVGVNINGLMYNGGYTRSNMFGLSVDYKFLIKRIIELLVNSGNQVLLIPHTYGDYDNVNSDPYACDDVKKRIYSDYVSILSSEHNQSEVKYIIGRCCFFIGSRMHSCIAALSQGIPTVGIAYSKKFYGIFESVGMEDSVVDCRINTNEIVEKKVMYLYEKRLVLQDKLKENARIISNKIIETFSIFLGKNC